MQVTNNDKVAKWFFYKVNGQTKKVNVPGQTSVQLPDLISMNQVIRNGYDVKVDHINSLLNRKLSGDFSVITTNTAPIDYHLLDTWYASLSVKPSAGLWTDLQALANGMKSDGDWDELDVFGMIACMETNEQRLRPFKTTSGSDFVMSGSPTLSFSGVQNSNPGSPNFLLANWSAAMHGVKYTQDSASIAIAGDTFVNIPVDNAFGVANSGYTSASYIQLTSSGGGTILRTYSPINSADNATVITKSPVIAGAKRYFVLSRRTSSTISNTYLNGNTSSNNGSVSTSLLNLNFAICAVNNGTAGFIVDTEQITRTVMMGSGNVVASRIESRLNTFFTARGLTISNY